VSRVSRLEDAQLCYSGMRTWKSVGRMDGFLNVALRCWRARGFGDFWIHMLVADGSGDVAMEYQVSLWDLAAPKVIVEEAGGRFTDLEGVPRADGGSALSSNMLLHEEVLHAFVGTG
jgi:histidinol-phosphatase